MIIIFLIMYYVGAHYVYAPCVEEKGAPKTVLSAASNKSDAAEPNQMNFQTPATAIMEKIVDLHHDLMFFIIVIVVFVS